MNLNIDFMKTCIISTQIGIPLGRIRVPRPDEFPEPSYWAAQKLDVAVVIIWMTNACIAAAHYHGQVDSIRVPIPCCRPSSCITTTS